MFKVSRRDNADRYYIFSLWGFALFVHHIHHSEEKDVYHSHPWSGFSLILGRYLEERCGDRPRIRRLLNFVPASRHHRIELPFGPVWTIFFHFRRTNRWTVVDKEGQTLATEPWRNTEGNITSYRPAT